MFFIVFPCTEFVLELLVFTIIPLNVVAGEPDEEETQAEPPAIAVEPPIKLFLMIWLPEET